MKYALISDIHGNAPALSAVLADAVKSRADRFVFLGDYYICMPYPNQVIDTVKTVPDSVVICGNNEEQLKEFSRSDQSRRTDGQFQALYWCYDEITPENKSYLFQLPARAVVDRRLRVAHRSSEFIGGVEMREFACDRLSEIFQDKTPDKTELDHVISEKLSQSAEFSQRLSGLPDGVYAFGHSHLQWHKNFGDKVFINPGSCGFPLDFAPGAPYTLLEISGREITVEERRAAYDEETCIYDLIRSPLHSRARIWNEILIREFQTRRSFFMPFLAFVAAYANRIGDPVRPYSKKTWSDAYAEWIKPH